MEVSLDYKPPILRYPHGNLQEAMGSASMWATSWKGVSWKALQYQVPSAYQTTITNCISEYVTGLLQRRSYDSTINCRLSWVGNWNGDLQPRKLLQMAHNSAESVQASLENSLSRLLTSIQGRFRECAFGVWMCSFLAIAFWQGAQQDLR